MFVCVCVCVVCNYFICICLILQVTEGLLQIFVQLIEIGFDFGLAIFNWVLETREMTKISKMKHSQREWEFRLDNAKFAGNENQEKKIFNLAEMQGSMTNVRIPHRENLKNV